METEEQMKARIDAQDIYALLHTHRFAPLGDPRFRGAEGDYRMKRLAELRAADPNEYVRVSKLLGR